MPFADDQTTDNALQPTRDVFSVSRLNLEVRAALENSFPLLWVTGEISNLSQPRSGHLYFTLKDQGAQVRCALFRSRRLRVRFAPSDGMQVLVRARITLFEPRGDFQLVIEHMEAAGEGALRQQVEALKARLVAEGLFDPASKKPVPAYPGRIGVITSPSGAAVHDVLTVLGRRCPAIGVVIYAVPVQGDQAAGEIRRMIEVADARGECDALILTRGGGSLEDLMAFNDEGVVRAVAACKLPVICAVGHEIDVTLSDFAADRRAPTPSAAAELASPDADATAMRFRTLAERLLRATSARVTQQRGRCSSLAARLALGHPGRRLQQKSQHCDELDRRLARQMAGQLLNLQSRTANLNGRLTLQSPAGRLKRERGRLASIQHALAGNIDRRLGQLHQQVAGLGRELQAVSPLGTLGRGYAIVRRTADGRVVRAFDEVAPGDQVEALLDRGALICRVESLEPEDNEA
jgi:exodeoxyribonuclease VII large subunit